MPNVGHRDMSLPQGKAGRPSHSSEASHQTLKPLIGSRVACGGVINKQTGTSLSTLWTDEEQEGPFPNILNQHQKAIDVEKEDDKCQGRPTYSISAYCCDLQYHLFASQSLTSLPTRASRKASNGEHRFYSPYSGQLHAGRSAISTMYTSSSKETHIASEGLFFPG